MNIISSQITVSEPRCHFTFTNEQKKLLKTIHKQEVQIPVILQSFNTILNMEPGWKNLCAIPFFLLAFPLSRVVLFMCLTHIQFASPCSYLSFTYPVSPLAERRTWACMCAYQHVKWKWFICVSFLWGPFNIVSGVTYF